MAACASEKAGDAIETSRRRGLLRFSEEFAQEIFAFQREAYPLRRPDWIEPRWRWMFLASAARVGVEPMVWFYRSKDRVVAHQGAIAVRLHTAAGDFTTGWFVETMALPEVRGKAIGPMVVAKALEDLPFNLSLGQTAHMRELQYRLGWKRVAPLETLMLIISGKALIAGKVPRLAAPVAGAALTAYQQWRYWRGRVRQSPPLQVREVSRFGSAHDALWRDVSPQYPVAVVRDASYLNWKYVDQPGQSFIRLELADDQRVRSVVVLSIVEPRGTYGYTRAWMTDIVVRPEDPATVWATLDAARSVSRQRGADLMLFEVVNESLVNHALRFGFIRREPSRVLLVAPGGAQSEVAQLVLDGRKWLATRGDSDIDRPASAGAKEEEHD
jgi:hypothetical protein